MPRLYVQIRDHEVPPPAPGAARTAPPSAAAKRDFEAVRDDLCVRLGETGAMVHGEAELHRGAFHAPSEGGYVTVVIEAGDLDAVRPVVRDALSETFPHLDVDVQPRPEEVAWRGPEPPATERDATETA